MRIAIITFITSIILSIASAYCTVIGIGRIFTYSPIITMIIASIIEFGRMVLIFVLHHFWKQMSWIKKIPGLIMLLIAMSLSSLGIFGYFSSAYSSNASEVIPIEMEVKTLEKEIELVKNQIVINDNQIQLIQKNMSSDVMNKAMETYIQKEYVSKALNVQKETQKQLETLVNENKELNNQVIAIQRKILDKTVEVEKKSPTIAHLKYVSKLLGTSNDNAIIIFIIMMMLVFDTLAMYLMITSDWIMGISQQTKNVDKKPQPKEESKTIKKIVQKPTIVRKKVKDISFDEIIETLNEKNVTNDIDKHASYVVNLIQKDKSLLDNMSFIKSLSKTPRIVEYIEQELGSDNDIVKKLKTKLKIKGGEK